MSDYAVQRLNMVESQVRPSDLTDRRIVRAMLALPREEFVPAVMKPVCYMDQDVAVTSGGDGAAARYILAPRVQAKLVQALQVPDDAIVLDVGTATGYSAALLSRLAQTVVAVEQDAQLAADASRTLQTLEVDNVAVVTAPLTEGCAAEGPYDAILINGAVDFVPELLLDQLKDGGRLVTIERDRDGIGHGVLWRRVGGQFARRVLFDAQAPALAGFLRKPSFVF